MPKIINDQDQAAVAEPAVGLAELAVEINAEHEAGEEATRKGLEHYRRAGEALIKAREACGGRKFKPWLKKHVKFGRTTAYSYIKLAENWSICSTAEHMRDALRLLVEDAEEGEAEEPAGMESAARETQADEPDESVESHEADESDEPAVPTAGSNNGEGDDNGTAGMSPARRRQQIRLEQNMVVRNACYDAAIKVYKALRTKRSERSRALVEAANSLSAVAKSLVELAKADGGDLDVASAD